MPESYEVVFQQIAPEHLHDLLECIQAKALDFSGLTASEDIEGIGGARLNRGLLRNMTSHNGNLCLTVRLHEVAVTSSITLPLVLVRVIKYNSAIDVELSFDDAPPLDMNCIMRTLHNDINSLSKKINIQDFYGGLEPASDINTRYFTGSSLGPLAQ